MSYRVLFCDSCPQSRKEKLIQTRLSVSGTIYVYVDSPNLSFPYWGTNHKKTPCSTEVSTLILAENPTGYPRISRMLNNRHESEGKHVEAKKKFSVEYITGPNAAMCTTKQFSLHSTSPSSCTQFAQFTLCFIFELLISIVFQNPQMFCRIQCNT